VRASLISATSLIALLIANEGSANATVSYTPAPHSTSIVGDTLVGMVPGELTTSDIVSYSGGGTSNQTINGIGNSGTTPTVSPWVLLRSGSSTSSVGFGSGNTVATALSSTGTAPVASVSTSAGGFALTGPWNMSPPLTASNTGYSDLVRKILGIGKMSGTTGGGSASVFVELGTTLNPRDLSSLGAATSSPSSYPYAQTGTNSDSATTSVNTFPGNGMGVSHGAGAVTTTLVGTPIGSLQPAASTAETQYTRAGGAAIVSTLTAGHIGNSNFAAVPQQSGTSQDGPVSSNRGAAMIPGGNNNVSSSRADATPKTARATSSPQSYTDSLTARTNGSSGSTASPPLSDGDNTSDTIAQTDPTALSYQAMGPVNASTPDGWGNAFSTTPAANGSTGVPGRFGTVGFRKSDVLNLDTSNTMLDLPGISTTPTASSIETFSITGANVANSSIGAGGSRNGDTEVELPIIVPNSDDDSLFNTSLVIPVYDYADGRGGIRLGDIFTPTLAVPELLGVASVGVGLVGLVGLLRRRKTA